MSERELNNEKELSSEGKTNKKAKTGQFECRLRYGQACTGYSEDPEGGD